MNANETSCRRAISRSFVIAAVFPIAILGTANEATATEPCGDFGECKVLVEINASDGDIGFHWLVDGDGQRSTRIDDPNGRKIWKDNTSGALRKQLKTENFGESSEPLCWRDPEASEDERIVTLKQFRRLWQPGRYFVLGKGKRGERMYGSTFLTFWLPAAPKSVEFDGEKIAWSPGDDLGRCATSDELDKLVEHNVLPVHPKDVIVRAWEVVMAPDVESGDPRGNLTFSIRLPGDVALKQVTVPADYLASLPANTPVKIEVGAIGGDIHGVGDDDNATFTESDGFCVNETAEDGCD